MTVIDEYFEHVEEPQRVALERIRAIVKDVAPEVEEVITYGMPGFKYKKKYLISFSAFKDHLSIFPGAEAIETYKDELSDFKLSKGTVQFTLENPIPDQLLKEIVQNGVDRINRS